MNKDDFEALLKKALGSDNVAYNKAKNMGFPRIVYAECGRHYLEADNVLIRRGWKVEVHYYTKEPFDARAETLENAFDEAGVSYFNDIAEVGDLLGNTKIITDDDVKHYIYICEI